jgi:hypothetical protein
VRAAAGAGVGGAPAAGCCRPLQRRPGPWVPPRLAQHPRGWRGRRSWPRASGRRGPSPQRRQGSWGPAGPAPAGACLAGAR